MRVLVCDDEGDVAKEIVEALAGLNVGIEVVEVLVGDKLTGHLQELFKAVRSCLTRPEEFKRTDLVFDAYDIVIIDNNLSYLGIEGARLTAEAIAGYVRAFTTIPYIVSVNKNPDVDFDLRYLVGDYESRADLALNTPHLANPALWSKKAEDAKDGFAPWYWPKLQLVHDRRREQVQFVLNNMDEPVLSALGFPTDEQSLEFLSLHARGSLYPSAELGAGAGKRLGEVTFRDVFTAWRRSIPADQDRATLIKGAAEGLPGFEEILGRVVAADIDHWLRRDVVAPQGLFVDVPHLLVRMPFLLGAHAKDIGAWNSAAIATDAPFGLDASLYQKHLVTARFEHDFWIPTPGFWWPVLKRDLELGKLFFKKDADWVSVVFCEDRSTFVEWPQGGAGEGPTPFIAEFEGSWGQRYVARVPNFQYQPQSRLTASKPA